MKNKIILQFALEEELMQEILRNDLQSKYVDCSTPTERMYRFDKILSKEKCSINEDGLLYLNDKIAFNLYGTSDERNLSYKTADLEIIPSEATVKKDGKIIRVCPRTYYMLLAFVRASNGYVSRKTLNQILEGKSGKLIQDNTLNQHINRLKKSLGSYNGKTYIDTLYELGYRWKYEVVVVHKD